MGETISVTFNGLWFVTFWPGKCGPEGDPKLGEMRWFESPRGWGKLMKIEPSQTHHGKIGAWDAVYRGARVPMSPTRKFVDEDGNEHIEPEPNYGIDQELIKGAVECYFGR